MVGWAATTGSPDWAAATILLSLMVLGVKGILVVSDLGSRMKQVEKKLEELDKLWGQRIESVERMSALQAGKIEGIERWQYALQRDEDRQRRAGRDG